MKKVSMAALRLMEYVIALSTYKRRLASFLEVPPQEIEASYREMDASAWLKEVLEKKRMRQRMFDLSMLSPLRAPALYALCRVLRPEIVVETGVAEGFSSAFILAALERNGAGRLYSIDLPNQPGQELSKEAGTGWLVPAGFRRRWELVIGSSREKLPPLLERLGKTDLFYHDSDHSYENMKFEFEAALARLSPGGVIAADDITDNRAFDDLRAAGRRSIKLFKLGVVKP